MPASIPLLLLLLAAAGPAAGGPPGEAAPAVPAPPPVLTSTPPSELEGVALGSSRASLARRLDLEGLVPFREGNELRFIIDPKMPLADRARRELDRRRVGRMELRFHDDRLSSVRVEYDDHRDLRFDDMERRLVEVYGEPSSIEVSGPMQVGRAHGVRLYLWLRIWTWRWADRTLVVEGKHYGDDKRVEKSLRHAYVFTLAEPRQEPADPVLRRE